MNVYDEGVTTMRVRWEAVQGATGYLLLYRSVNASEPQEEKEVTCVSRLDVLVTPSSSVQ